MTRIEAAIRRLAESYDADGPYRGRCGLCGEPDGRHRIVDSWTDLWLAGDDPAWIAREWSVKGGALDVMGAVAATLAWDVEARKARLSRQQQAEAWDIFWPIPASPSGETP